MNAGAAMNSGAPVRDAVSAELVLARAGAAARGGDLDEADRLLRNLEAGAGLRVAQLDLLARVCAQRGDVADADACWAQVQAIDPENPAAAAGRQVIAEISAGRRRARPVPHPGVSLIAAASVCAVLATAAIWVGTSDVVEPASPPVAADPGGDPAVAPSETQPADAAREVTRNAALVDELIRNLTFPGVRVGKHADGVEVVFDQGLFSRSDRLTPAGATKLAELGRRLAGRDVSTTVVGHAVAVAGGPASGGSVVAHARAAVAAQVLGDASGVPLTAFTLLSGDQTRNPFPDRERSRTVTLLIVPDAETR